MKFMDVLDPLQMRKGGLLWKPLKQATGLSDAQMAGAGLLAVAAPYALPAMASGAPAAAGATEAGATAAQGGLLSKAGAMFSGLFGEGSGVASSGSSGMTLGGGVPEFGSEMGGGTGSGFFSTLGSAGKPLLGGAEVGMKVAEMMKPQPMQPGQLAQRPGPDLSQFIAAEQQRNQMMDQERQKRMQQQQMALGGLLGGGYGRNA